MIWRGPMKHNLIEQFLDNVPEPALGGSGACPQ